VETTVYTRVGHYWRGIGQALHEAFGFEHVGTLEDIGYKLGRWCSTGLWQRRRGVAGEMPGEILPIAAI